MVDYNTHQEWVDTTPEGKDIVFKCNTVIYNRIPYIDMRSREGLSMLNTVCNNFEEYTNK